MSPLRASHRFPRWLPSILEISLLGLKTHANLAVGELIAFLALNPSPREVHGYRLPAPLQARVERLLEQNRSDALSDADHRELDECMALEHVVRLFKKRLATVELART